MLAERPPVALPRVLIAYDGREPIALPAGLDLGVLLRDTDLPTLIEATLALEGVPLAVDLATVRGLEGDDAAVDFVCLRLGIGIVLARRPAVAARVASLGGLALQHVLAFDSTGLARSLEGHPRSSRIGSVVSPGLVLAHMSRHEFERLPPPILAYGLIDAPADAWACLAMADGIVLRPDAAVSFLNHLGPESQSAQNLLTTVAARE